MKGLLSALKWLISTFKTLIGFLMTILESFVMVFRYLIKIVDIIFTTITSLPDWIVSFIIITVGITIAYFLIGRNTGKSD